MTEKTKAWTRVDQFEVTIDREKCIFCLNCFEACPQEVYDIDYENSKIDIVLPKECLICLHCEEACPTGAIFIKGAIRKQFKPTPVKDMWGWEGIKPPE